MMTVSEEGDEALRGGSLRCPNCQGALRPWGFARLREVRIGGTSGWVRPRRARCGSCERTQVLLPCRLLKRRRDAAADIGKVLDAYARGSGYRRVARERAIPVATARNWVRRLRGRWTRLLLQFLPATSPPKTHGADDPMAAVLAIQGASAVAGWSARAWDFASLVTNGGVLSPNTT